MHRARRRPSSSTIAVIAAKPQCRFGRYFRAKIYSEKSTLESKDTQKTDFVKLKRTRSLRDVSIPSVNRPPVQSAH